ncbi:response regulator transcription factor [Termitidicoccus mucosus]|uniref:LuxR family transcriptional regulator n=1 Tax=Termitidicoccus mucosus TaxID=1184151 RepID=A0A178IPQ6_9BACT|nr:hypothetical protein AW736_23285 [Opitutaceae bacterium TSB47]OAM91853.1 hypothetical protein AW736_26580 [Opitutaceae bacterium TSB47]
MSIKVAVVEDNADIARDIAQIITETPDFELCCVCRNVQSALKRIPPLMPDVVIMDINLPDGSGIQATEKIKRIIPHTEVMILTIYENTEEIFKALKAGANGYLLKRSSGEEIVTAIRDLMNGEGPMTGEIARKVMQLFRKPDVAAQTDALKEKLTPREIEILQLLSKGHTSKDIAREISLSAFTVRTHLRNIYEKLRVHTRTEAVVKFLKGD